MPGRHFYTTRRYYAAKRIGRWWRRKKRYRKKRYTKKLTYKVKRLQQKVYNNLQPGWIDTFMAPTAIGAGGDITGDFCNLENIAVGTEHDDRIGNKIVVKKLHLKGNISVASGDIFNEVRIIIFSMPDVCSTGIPNIVDILQTGDLYSFYKKDSPVKYKIHYDKTWQLSNPYRDVGTVAPIKLNGMAYPNYIHWEKKLVFPKGHAVHYDGPGVGAPTRGGFYMLRISDSLSSIPSGHPLVSAYCRMSYDP